MQRLQHRGEAFLISHDFANLLEQTIGGNQTFIIADLRENRFGRETAREVIQLGKYFGRGIHGIDKRFARMGIVTKPSWL